MQPGNVLDLIEIGGRRKDLADEPGISLWRSVVSSVHHRFRAYSFSTFRISTPSGVTMRTK